MTPEAQRYAVYFTPKPETPLARFGAAVLGYEADAGERVPHLDWPGIDPTALEAITAEPRRYGFHATLKAPFRLAEGFAEEALADAVRALAASQPVVPVGRLRPVLLGAFVALVPAEPSRRLDLLAAECVAALDRFRAPLDKAEFARRCRAGLTTRQAALLGRWGYPYVFEEFRFHMTLTGPIATNEADGWLRGLSDAFAPMAENVVLLDALTLLHQDPGEAFRVVARFPFAGERG